MLRAGHGHWVLALLLPVRCWARPREQGSAESCPGQNKREADPGQSGGNAGSWSLPRGCRTCWQAPQPQPPRRGAAAAMPGATTARPQGAAAGSSWEIMNVNPWKHIAITALIYICLMVWLLLHFL